MSKKSYYIIDFDSTFTQVEALDELARISLKNHPNREDIYRQIEEYTNLAMEGKLSFSESLAQRVKLLEANKKDLKKLILHLKKKVSKSFSRNEDFFKKHADDVLIVSGGFKEFIEPVVRKYHIKKKNIYANDFIFDEDDKIVDYNHGNPLSEEGGKVKLLQNLKLEGELFGIGDGYSDFQLRESGLINKFFAFTENIERKTIIERADHVTPSFDEFLYVNKLPQAISYPKNRILCLIIGEVDARSIALLKTDGFSIRHKDSFEEKYVQDVGMMLLGKDVAIDDKQLRAAEKLKTIGCVDKAKHHIDVELCSKMGIVVFDNDKKNPNHIDFIPRRMIDFINKGDTYLSKNFPNLQLPRMEQSHRLIHIHHNVPGIMAQINQVFASYDINIVSQFLMTNSTLGYAITDINKQYDKQVIKALKKIDNTIKFRVLY